MSVTTNDTHHVENIHTLLSEWAEYGRTLTISYGGLTVPSNTTTTITAGSTTTASEVEVAGTTENAGTLESGRPPDSSLHTVASGEVDHYSTVENAGTIENAGTMDSGSDPWSTKPVVRYYWEDAQSERGPGSGQPPVIYVWSPTGSTLDRFSMDGVEFDRQDTVEVQVWSLDATTSKALVGDVVDVLSVYLDDNRVTTPYSDVAPTNLEDFREQNPARQTDHYVMSVEVETRGLHPTHIVPDE